jgi:hypothetical protein
LVTEVIDVLTVPIEAREKGSNVGWLLIDVGIEGGANGEGLEDDSASREPGICQPSSVAEQSTGIPLSIPGRGPN